LSQINTVLQLDNDTLGRKKFWGRMIQADNIGDGEPVSPQKDYAALEQENTALRSKIAELERMVVRDTLTPLYNRRYFMSELDRWCWRARRYGGHYGLVFIDVDNLKVVNDSFGHGAGDDMLIEIAKSLNETVRRSDILARIGGDEFAVLLDNIPTEQLQPKSDHMVDAVAKLSIEHHGHILVPSISAGYTAIEPGIKASELLLRADRSMYAAKQAKDLSF
jgi:diguanylate cyclase (GGDEF)-like protein